MRQVITVSIVLAAIGGLVQSASAVPTSCEKNYQKCMDNTPWGQTTAPCLRAVLKCEADARNNPDAITSAGPRVPRGEKGEKPGKGPGKGGTKLTSPSNVKTNASGALASTPAATKPASAATSGGAASGAATNNAKQTAGKPEAVPPQLAERLRRMQRQ